MNSRNSCQPGNEYVLIGKVTKPHGIKGEVKVFLFSGETADFPYSEILLAGPREMQTFRVVGRKSAGTQVVLQLGGITAREQAETLVNQEIWIKEEQLPPLAAEEFYWHRLVGMRAVTTDGREIGTVSGLQATGAHDLLVVKGDDREYLIPAVGDFLVQVNEEEKILTIAPIPGLLELNA